MFNIFSKKKTSLGSVGDGKVIDLSTVEDEAFASKAIGEGVAIELLGNVVHSPIDGEVAVLFNTKHAFVIHTKDNLDILVHIGFDTVNLKGEGFKALVSQGDIIKRGDPIIKFDKEFINSKGLSTTTVVVITNMELIKEISNKIIDKNVKISDDLFEYSVV